MNDDKKLKYNEPWIMQRADPYVYKHIDGMYYFTASIPHYDAIVLRRARTLAEIAEAKEIVVWEKHETGIMSEHVWAPEIHYINQKWYIYFAAGEKENPWEIRPYVLECTGKDPCVDEWCEKGKIQAAEEDDFSFKAFSLDATIFENKGVHYCVWAEKVGVGKQISNLYIAEMENPYTLKTAQVLISTPDYNWERKGFWVNEGPAVLKHNGKLFLTYSASETGIDYCIGMLSAKEEGDMLDPLSWQKERTPVFKTVESKSLYGPGHNSFTKDEEGNDVMVYHARTEKEIIGNPLYNPNRHAMIMRIQWDEGGRPVFTCE